MNRLVSRSLETTETLTWEIRKRQMITFGSYIFIVIILFSVLPRPIPAKALTDSPPFSFVQKIIPDAKSDKGLNIQIDLLSYHEAGYQCTAKYTGEAKMSAVRYCQHYGIPKGFWYIFYSHIVRFGKYFPEIPSNASCYVMDEMEEEPGLRPDTNFLAWTGIKYERIYHLAVRGGSKFVHATNYSDDGQCRTSSFKHPSPLYVQIKESQNVRVHDFIIGRAVIWSEECKQTQLIPALYSQEWKLCFFGDGVGRPLRDTSECQILCLPEA